MEKVEYANHLPTIVRSFYEGEIRYRGEGEYANEWIRTANNATYEERVIRGKNLLLMHIKEEGTFVFDGIEGPSMTLGLYLSWNP